MLIKNAKVLLGEEFYQIDLRIKNKYIAEIGSGLYREEEEKIYNFTNQYVVPGFIDIHTHGGAGHDINASNSEELDEISQFFAKQGVTSFLGSVLTDTEEQTNWCIDQFNDRIEKGCSGARLMGIHLEGPFLSPKFKGAMPEHLLKSGDIELLKRYQKRANGNIKYITIAPEIESNMEMIKEIEQLGIKVAMGHSDATYEEGVKAIQNGVACSTHLMNAMRPIHQHEIGIAGASLIHDIYVETIVDGLHLKPSTLKFIAHNKGLDKMIGITDCIMAAGLPDGNYKLGVNDVVVINGDARLAHEDVRAGSTLRMSVALKNLSKFLELPIEKVEKILSKNPADMLGLRDRGQVKEGMLADFAILDSNFDVEKTVVGGDIVYEK